MSGKPHSKQTQQLPATIIEPEVTIRQSMQDGADPYQSGDHANGRCQLLNALITYLSNYKPCYQDGERIKSMLAYYKIARSKNSPSLDDVVAFTQSNSNKLLSANLQTGIYRIISDYKIDTPSDLISGLPQNILDEVISRIPYNSSRSLFTISHFFNDFVTTEQAKRNIAVNQLVGFLRCENELPTEPTLYQRECLKNIASILTKLNAIICSEWIHRNDFNDVFSLIEKLPPALYRSTCISMFESVAIIAMIALKNNPYLSGGIGVNHNNMRDALISFSTRQLRSGKDFIKKYYPSVDPEKAELKLGRASIHPAIVVSVLNPKFYQNLCFGLIGPTLSCYVLISRYGITRIDNEDVLIDLKADAEFILRDLVGKIDNYLSDHSPAFFMN